MCVERRVSREGEEKFRINVKTKSGRDGKDREGGGKRGGDRAKK